MPAAAAAAAATQRLRRLLRIDSLLVALAVVLHVVAGGLAAWRARLANAEDWWVYALMGLTSAIVLTNYGRLGARVSLLRRGAAGLVSLVVVLAWAALLADRATPSLGALQVGRSEPWLWVSVGLEVAVKLLIVAHLVAVAPRSRSARRDNAKQRQAAWDEATRDVSAGDESTSRQAAAPDGPGGAA